MTINKEQSIKQNNETMKPIISTILIIISFTVSAQDFNAIIDSANTNYTQGVSIGLRGNTTDDCTNNMTGLSTIYFNLTNQRTGTTETCASTEEEGDGWYNCTWDSSGKDTGYHTVTMFSNESYYNYGNTTTTFYLSSTPVFEDETVLPATGGWGASPYNYTVNITDVDNDTLTISFWLNGTGLWVEDDTGQCENCSDTVMNFTNTYTCSDMGAWYYKFNTTDPNNNPAESSLNWHNVTEDKISLNLKAGNNSEINRSSGSVNLSITVYDFDADSNTTDLTTGNISFWFKNETSVWKEETYDDKNSTEYFIDFNPGCDYDVGIRAWKVNQTQDTCYSTNQTDEFVVTVYGSMNNLIIAPDDDVYVSGTSVLITSNITTDCDQLLTDASVNFTVNGTSYNDVCLGSYNATSYQYECDWNSTGAPAGTYNLTMISERSYYNDNATTKISAVNFTKMPELAAASVTPESDGWALNRTFRLNVTDPGDTVTAYLWIKKGAGTWQQQGSSQECNDCTASQLEWNSSFTHTDISAVDGWEFKFNVTDLESNSYETTGADYASDEYFTIEKDDVRIDYIAGNETSVNKTNYTTFVMRLWDTDNNSAVSAPASTITFNITRDGTAYLTEGANTTNSSGFVEYNFQASCVYYPGKQKWLAFLPSTDTYYKYNVSEELNVTLDMLCPEFNITGILTPAEAFQYKPFEVNISLQVVDYNATAANATLSTDSWSVTPSENQYFSVIQAGVGQIVYEKVMWTINATGMTPYVYPFVINFSANTTTPAPEGFYSDTDETSVTVYRLLEESCPEMATNGTDVKAQLCTINANIGESLDDSASEALLSPGESLVSSWDCRAAEYRIANITAIWEAEGIDNSTSARVEVYNGTSWIDVAHSSPVGINASEENVFVLDNILYANESGYCRANITNVGEFGLYIDYLVLE